MNGRLALLLMCSGLACLGQKLEIPVHIGVDGGKPLFTGMLSVDVTGNQMNALFDWSLEVKNATSLWLKEIEFCIVFLGQDGAHIKDIGGRGCLVRMRRYNVDPDQVMTAKGKQSRTIRPLNLPFKIYGAEAFILDIDKGEYEATTGFKRTPDTRDLFDKTRIADEASRREPEARMKDLPAKEEARPRELRLDRSSRDADEREMSMSISSEPFGAEVFIDGESKGNTPALVKVKPGSRRFELKKAGYATYIRILTIKTGEALNINGTLEKVE